MKKWEEERKKRQYADKIKGVKPTLSTQPKGYRKSTTGGSSIGQNEETKSSLYPDHGIYPTEMDGQYHQFGMFNMSPQLMQSDIMDHRSPQVTSIADNLNYKQLIGMNATEYDKNQKLKESTIPVSQYTGGGSQYAKPKLRASNSNVGKRNNEPIKRETKTQNVTDVPIYQLLKEIEREKSRKGA